MALPDPSIYILPSVTYINLSKYVISLCTAHTFRSKPCLVGPAEVSHILGAAETQDEQEDGIEEDEAQGKARAVPKCLGDLMQAHDADDKTGDRADPAHEGQQEAVTGALDDAGQQLQHQQRPEHAGFPADLIQAIDVVDGDDALPARLPGLDHDPPRGHGDEDVEQKPHKDRRRRDCAE